MALVVVALAISVVVEGKGGIQRHGNLRSRSVSQVQRKSRSAKLFEHTIGADRTRSGGRNGDNYIDAFSPGGAEEDRSSLGNSACRTVRIVEVAGYTFKSYGERRGRNPGPCLSAEGAVHLYVHFADQVSHKRHRGIDGQVRGVRRPGEGFLGGSEIHGQPDNVNSLAESDQG